jgi:hypothetical protein
VLIMFSAALGLCLSRRGRFESRTQSTWPATERSRLKTWCFVPYDLELYHDEAGGRSRSAELARNDALLGNARVPRTA